MFYKAKNKNRELLQLGSIIGEIVIKASVVYNNR
jgi:hypothetical protein